MFPKLKILYDRIGNVATEQKKQNKTEELVDSITKENNPFQNVVIEDIWIEEDLFDSKDSEPIINASTKIIDEITPDPLIDLNIATTPDTDDEMEDDINFNITDSQLVQENDTSVNKETEPFVDFNIADSRVVDSNNEIDDIDFTITDSQLVERNHPNVNRDTEPFVDFTITGSRNVDSGDGIETINIMMADDITIPNTNVIGKGTGALQRKRIVTSHLTQAVSAAEKIKKKYRQKQIGKKPARISTDGRLKQQNKKGTEWLKNEGCLDDEVPVEKADVGETIHLKSTSGAAIAAKNIVKKYRNLARKKPYRKRPARIFTEDNDKDVEDIIDLGDIATLKPSKNAQIAAKKIS